MVALNKSEKGMAKLAELFKAHGISLKQYKSKAESKANKKKQGGNMKKGLMRSILKLVIAEDKTVLQEALGTGKVHLQISGWRSQLRHRMHSMMPTPLLNAFLEHAPELVDAKYVKGF
jgi:hypothetical protein